MTGSTPTLTPTPTRRVVLTRRIALLAGACAALACGGCYERVVGARGAAADQYDISEPYQQTGPVDRWFWGDTKEAGEYKSKPGIRTN